MAEQHFDVGVVVAKTKLKSPWADHQWLPHAVLPAVPAAAPGTALGADGASRLIYAGAGTLALHPADTAHYRDNLASGRPSLWVSLRLLGDDTVAVAGVTADPYEGEALTDGIGAVVEAVPMPAEIEARVAAFVAAFHVERPFFKRTRERADPDALGHRPRVAVDRRRERT